MAPTRAPTDCCLGLDPHLHHAALYGVTGVCLLLSHQPRAPRKQGSPFSSVHPLLCFTRWSPYINKPLSFPLIKSMRCSLRLRAVRGSPPQGGPPESLTLCHRTGRRMFPASFIFMLGPHSFHQFLSPGGISHVE